MRFEEVIEELFKRLLVALASNFVISQISRHGSPCGCDRCFSAAGVGFIGGEELVSAILSRIDT